MKKKRYKVTINFNCGTSFSGDYDASEEMPIEDIAIEFIKPILTQELDDHLVYYDKDIAFAQVVDLDSGAVYDFEYDINVSLKFRRQSGKNFNRVSRVRRGKL